MRNTTTVTIGPEGQRDAGKVFRITEMHPKPLEAWGGRLVFMLARAGVDIVAHLSANGLGTLPRFAPDALRTLAWADVAPLLADMMGCVELVGAEVPEGPSPLRPGDIEELATQWRLREEWMRMHMAIVAAALPAADPAPAVPAAPAGRHANRPRT